jgi:hypothetical protein
MAIGFSRIAHAPLQKERQYFQQIHQLDSVRVSLQVLTSSIIFCEEVNRLVQDIRQINGENQLELESELNQGPKSMRSLLGQLFLNYVTTKSIMMDMEVEELEVPEEPLSKEVAKA